MPASRTDDPEKSPWMLLGKEAFETAVAANKIVCRRMLQMANHDMRALSDALKTGLEVIMPVAQSERSVLRESQKNKSDALLRAGTILFRGARDTMVVAAETRSELHDLILKRLQEAVDAIDRNSTDPRSARRATAAHAGPGDKRSSDRRSPKGPAKASTMTIDRGSTSKSRRPGPNPRKRVKRSSQSTVARGSSKTQKSSVKSAATDPIGTDKTARKNPEQASGPSNE